MTEAPAMPIDTMMALYGDPSVLAAAGRFALELGRLPNRGRNFGVFDGGRRMLADRTPRPPVDLKIVSRKENQR